MVCLFTDSLFLKVISLWLIDILWFLFHFWLMNFKSFGDFVTLYRWFDKRFALLLITLRRQDTNALLFLNFFDHFFRSHGLAGCLTLTTRTATRRARRIERLVISEAAGLGALAPQGWSRWPDVHCAEWYWNGFGENLATLCFQGEDVIHSKLEVTYFPVSHGWKDLWLIG